MRYLKLILLVLAMSVASETRAQIVADSSRNGIHTIQLFKSGFELSLPLIKLGSDEKVTLSFDDLENELRNFKYSLELCNSDGTTSNLPLNRYMEGFAEEQIRNFSYSVNTIQTYIHYETEIPGQNMLLLKSGIYRVKVYEENNPDSILFSRFFYVLDEKCTINGRVMQATLIEQKKFKQEVDLKVRVNSDFEIAESYKNLKLIIRQNGRSDNAITTLKPRLSVANEFDYNYDRENTFNGGNEYRMFDVKSLRYFSEHTQDITFNNQINNVYLTPDQRRPFKVYKTEEDLNGKFYIKANDTRDSRVEADYFFAHFSLPYEFPVVDGDIYLLGELTDWQLKPEAKLIYNYPQKAYQTTLWLKQGYYNYFYVFVKKGETILDETFVEGNHWETENDYYVFIYYRDPSDNYDRLIGYRKFNSINDNKAED